MGGVEVRLQRLVTWVVLAYPCRCALALLWVVVVRWSWWVSQHSYGGTGEHPPPAGEWVACVTDNGHPPPARHCGSASCWWGYGRVLFMAMLLL